MSCIKSIIIAAGAMAPGFLLYGCNDDAAGHARCKGLIRAKCSGKTGKKNGCRWQAASLANATCVENRTKFQSFFNYDDDEGKKNCKLAGGKFRGQAMDRNSTMSNFAFPLITEADVEVKEVYFHYDSVTAKGQVRTNKGTREIVDLEKSDTVLHVLKDYSDVERLLVIEVAEGKVCYEQGWFIAPVDKVATCVSPSQYLEIKQKVINTEEKCHKEGIIPGFSKDKSAFAWDKKTQHCYLVTPCKSLWFDMDSTKEEFENLFGHKDGSYRYCEASKNVECMEVARDGCQVAGSERVSELQAEIKELKADVATLRAKQAKKQKEVDSLLDASAPSHNKCGWWGEENMAEKKIGSGICDFVPAPGGNGTCVVGRNATAAANSTKKKKPASKHDDHEHDHDDDDDDDAYEVDETVIFLQDELVVVRAKVVELNNKLKAQKAQKAQAK